MAKERLEKTNKNNIERDANTEKIYNNVVDGVVAPFVDKKLDGEQLVHYFEITDQESKKCEEKSEEVRRLENNSSRNNSFKKRVMTKTKEVKIGQFQKIVVRKIPLWTNILLTKYVMMLKLKRK